MPEDFAVIYLKFKQRGQILGYLVKMMQMEKQTVKTLIRLLPDQTAPLGAVWSGSALFAQTDLLWNLRSLQYVDFDEIVLIDELNIWD